jgi:hypothetical protein
VHALILGRAQTGEEFRRSSDLPAPRRKLLMRCSSTSAARRSASVFHPLSCAVMRSLRQALVRRGRLLRGDHHAGCAGGLLGCERDRLFRWRPRRHLLPRAGHAGPGALGRGPTAQVLIAPAPPATGWHWWFDPRSILAGVVARFAALGLTPVVANASWSSTSSIRGAMRRDASHPPAPPGPAGRPRHPRVLAFDKLDEWAGLLAEIDAACIAQGSRQGPPPPNTAARSSR